MRRFEIVAAILAFAFVPPAFCEGTNAPANQDFSAFQIIVQRNIFNPNRSARGSKNAAADEGAKPPKTDVFGLVGTMIYEKGKFAFFEGSSPEYRKVLSPSDKIAGYTVKEIEPSHVTLEHDGKDLEMTVGQQMKRQGEGEWTLSTTREPIVASAASDKESSSGAGASGGSSAEDEVLKRLLQKREEELKK
jgi:hypothetical protein